MFGVTQQVITGHFNSQTFCKLLTLTMASGSNAAEVKYLFTIMLPTRTVTGNIVCKAGDNAKNKYGFKSVFSFGRVSIDMNGPDDFKRVLEFLKLLNGSKENGMHLVQNSNNYYLKLLEQEKQVQEEVEDIRLAMQSSEETSEPVTTSKKIKK